MRTAGILLVTALALAGVSARTAPVPAFQPVLVAFDVSHDRLYSTVPAEAGSRSSLVFFSGLGQEGSPVPSSMELPGVASGLFYDAETNSLFIANSSDHELLIFDRVDSGSVRSPTRVLRKFTFPTGVYVDRAEGRLFVLDAHPGSLLVFDHGSSIRGERQPDRLISGRKSGLNGPFSIAADPKRSRLYVSNFDGVLIFNLHDLSAAPERLDLPSGTLARGLALDPQSGWLYIAAPMIHSLFVYDGLKSKRVKIQGETGLFPFSLALDSNRRKIFLSGVDPKIGVMNLPAPVGSDGTIPEEQSIERWFQLEGNAPPHFEHPVPPAPPGGISSPPGGFVFDKSSDGWKAS